MSFPTSNNNILRRQSVSFLRPNNATPYVAFSYVTDGTTMRFPAPVRDRPFFIRRVELQIVPGNSVAVNYTLVLYTNEPTVPTDGVAMSQVANAQAGIMVGTYTIAVAAGFGGAINFGTAAIGTDFMIESPTGLIYAHLFTNTAYTPSENQKFTFNIYTEST